MLTTAPNLLLEIMEVSCEGGQPSGFFLRNWSPACQVFTLPGVNPV